MYLKTQFIKNLQVIQFVIFLAYISSCTLCIWQSFWSKTNQSNPLFSQHNFRRKFWFKTPGLRKRNYLLHLWRVDPSSVRRRGVMTPIGASGDNGGIATKLMHSSDCNQVNPTEKVHPSECKQVNATKWKQQSGSNKVNAT